MRSKPKTARGRASLASRLILRGHVNAPARCRALDNCFEEGDGDEVARLVLAEIASPYGKALARAVVRQAQHMPPEWTDAASRRLQAANA